MEMFLNNIIKWIRDISKKVTIQFFNPNVEVITNIICIRKFAGFTKLKLDRKIWNSYRFNDNVININFLIRRHKF